MAVTPSSVEGLDTESLAMEYQVPPLRNSKSLEADVKLAGTRKVVDAVHVLVRLGVVAGTRQHGVHG